MEVNVLIMVKHAIGSIRTVKYECRFGKYEDGNPSTVLRINYLSFLSSPSNQSSCVLAVEIKSV